MLSPVLLASACHLMPFPLQMATEAKTNPLEQFAWAVKTGDIKSVKDFVEKEKMNVNMTDASRY